MALSKLSLPSAGSLAKSSAASAESGSRSGASSIQSEAESFQRRMQSQALSLAKQAPEEDKQAPEFTDVNSAGFMLTMANFGKNSQIAEATNLTNLFDGLRATIGLDDNLFQIGGRRN